MNLFVTDVNPLLAAQHLDDVRLRKMVLETCQMLCTELRRRGHDMPYRSTHASHPVAAALSDNQVMDWTVRYMVWIDYEYGYRFGRRHASAQRCLPAILGAWRPLRQYERWTGLPLFHNSARNLSRGLDFTHLSVPESYRAYLCARWASDVRPPVWTRRERPEWARGDQHAQHR